MSIVWQCPFEDFVFAPSVSGNVLNISAKVRKHEWEFPSQEFVKWVETNAFWHRMFEELLLLFVEM